MKLFRKKAVIFLIAYSIVTISVLFSFYRYIDMSLTSHMMASLSELSNQNVSHVATAIDYRVRPLEEIAKQLSKKDDYTDFLRKSDDISQALNFREIGIAYADGKAYMSTNTIYDVSERMYFIESMQGHNWITNSLVDMRDSSPINVYSTPIFKDNKVHAVLFGIESTEKFSKNFLISMYSGLGYTFLINSSGDVIVNSPEIDIISSNLYNDLEHDISNTKVIEELPSIFSGQTSTNLKVKFKEYQYINVSPLGIDDWWLVTGVPEKVLNRQVEDITIVIQGVAVAFYIVSLLILMIYLKGRKNQEVKLANIAYVDPLTGLYNKAYISENFKNYIHQGNKKALVMYNISKFKLINEIYGENVGNEVLKQIAEKLKNEIKTHEIAIREYGDQFFVIYNYQNRQELEARILNIINQIQYVKYQSNTIKINLKVGIYEIEKNSPSFEIASSYAKIAKNECQNDINCDYYYYTDDLKQREISNKHLNDEIMEAIANKEFKAWFQPQFDFKTNKVGGVEALVRWHKPNGDILSPYYFVDYCEKNGLIQEIDRLVIEDVCINIAKWIEQGVRCVPVSVNVSRAYINDVSAIYYIKDVVDKYKVPPHLITIEITESAIIDNEEGLIKIIELIHELGFTVSLDDFGVGYSSLAAINNLNLDILKIDKSFIDTIGQVRGNQVLNYTIQLGKGLNMQLIAEGVESREQFSYLKDKNCDMMQGYYFSKPLPSKDYAEMMKE